MKKSVYRPKVGSSNNLYDSIFAYETTSFNSKDKIVLNDMELSLFCGNVDEDLSDSEYCAKKILTDAGLPTSVKEVINKPDGSTCNILGLLMDKPLTREWRAAQILRWVESVRRHIKNNDTRGAVYASLRLQSNYEHLLFSQFDLAINLGQRQIQAGKNSRYNDGSVHKKWEKRRDELFNSTKPKYKYRGKPNLTAISKLIAKESDQSISWETIRSYLNKCKKI